MLSFFPTPYKDELLYSVIARYHIRSANLCYSHTANDITGSIKRNKISVYFPSGISKITSQLPPNSILDDKMIVNEHTLYRLYTAFLPEDVSEHVLNKMLNGDSEGIMAQLGICASKIEVPKYFRFCPECAREDLEKYGEMYWHRMHQVSCVLICTKHKVLLQNSTVKLSASTSNEYIAANKENCNLLNKANILIKEKEFLNMLYNLGKNVEYLLNNKVENRNQQWFVNNYKNYLMEKGIATYNGNVRQKDLIEKFKKYYGEEFLNIMNSNINYKNNPNNWLSCLTRNMKNNIHPIRHLLLIGFLGISIEDIFKEEYRYKPFGDGPWPCLNSICSNYRKDIIKEIEIKFDGDRNKVRGIFTCECGFTYSRDSLNKDRYVISKVLEFGVLWENKLIELVNQKQFTLVDLASMLNVAWNTVDLHAERLQLDTYWRRDREDIRYPNNIKEKQYNLDTNKLVYYRDVWLKIRQENPQKNREELKRINSIVYFWLYNNDKKWLYNNMPEVKNKVNYREIIDWDERDEKILVQVKTSVRKILNSNRKPRQITKLQIFKMMDISTSLYRQLNKLPKTEEYLNNILENKEQFIKRKVKWAIEVLKEDGILISKNEIMKKITVGKKYRNLLGEIIQKEINNYID